MSLHALQSTRHPWFVNSCAIQCVFYFVWYMLIKTFFLIPVFPCALACVLFGQFGSQSLQIVLSSNSHLPVTGTLSLVKTSSNFQDWLEPVWCDFPSSARSLCTSLSSVELRFPFSALEWECAPVSPRISFKVSEISFCNWPVGTRVCPEFFPMGAAKLSV